MSISKEHALASQPVDIWRGHLRLRIVTGDVPVTEIVGENEKNVRLVQLFNRLLQV